MKAAIKQSHWRGEIFSFKKIIAKIAAKIGAKYLSETAEPKGIILMATKKVNIESVPTTALLQSNFLCVPQI